MLEQIALAAARSDAHALGTTGGLLAREGVGVVKGLEVTVDDVKQLVGQ